MLVIRQEQFDALSAGLLEQFEDRMVADLRNDFPNQTAATPEAPLRVQVRAGIEKARTYGVVDEFDIERYLQCMVLHGQDFDVTPRTAWAGEILRTPGLPGDKKMDQINNHQIFALKGKA